MHMPWMTQSANQKYVQKFMDYVLDKPDQDVWVSPMQLRLEPACNWEGSGDRVQGQQTPLTLPTLRPSAPPIFNPDPPLLPPRSL